MFSSAVVAQSSPGTMNPAYLVEATVFPTTETSQTGLVKPCTTHTLIPTEYELISSVFVERISSDEILATKLL